MLCRYAPDTVYVIELWASVANSGQAGNATHHKSERYRHVQRPVSKRRMEWMRMPNWRAEKNCQLTLKIQHVIRTRRVVRWGQHGFGRKHWVSICWHWQWFADSSICVTNKFQSGEADNAVLGKMSIHISHLHIQLNPRVGSLQHDARNENMSAVASVPLGPCASHIADGYVVRVLFDIPYSASSFVEEVHRGMWLVLLQHHKAVAAEPIGCINRTHPPHRPRFGTICVSSLLICPGTGVII